MLFVSFDSVVIIIENLSENLFTQNKQNSQAICITVDKFQSIFSIELITARIETLSDWIYPKWIHLIRLGRRTSNGENNVILFWCYLFLILVFAFISSFISCRETDVTGLTAFSKCQMYDVDWTTIQSWDYENWNSTRHQEKLNVLGKYCQVTKLNKRKRNKK